jgi:hypothetical protein
MSQYPIDGRTPIIRISKFMDNVLETGEAIRNTRLPLPGTSMASKEMSAKETMSLWCVRITCVQHRSLRVSAKWQ